MLKGILLGVTGILGIVGCRIATEDQIARPIPIVYSKDTSIDLFGVEKLHPFDVKKYDKIYECLKSDGYVSAEMDYKPEVLTDEDLKLVHTAEYLNNLNDKGLVSEYLEAPILQTIPGLNIKKNVVQPFINSAGGTLKAARLALKTGAAINIGGGYHHAMPDRGEGFCIIADVPIAIKKLQKEGLIKRALIIDTDIHQGNGTVICLQNDPTTFTFSIHEQDIYPWPKPAGDWDIGISAGVTDDLYAEHLAKTLPEMIRRSKPDIVFHVSGCDSLEGDPLANGSMTAAGIAKRDLMILEACEKHSIPYVMTLAGGYSKNAWKVQSDSIKGLMQRK